MITPVDLQTLVVKGNEIAQNAAQILNAHTAMLQLFQSEILKRSQQELRQVNPENKTEAKMVKTSTEGERRNEYYYASRPEKRENTAGRIKEENKGSLLDVRL